MHLSVEPLADRLGQWLIHWHLCATRVGHEPSEQPELCFARQRDARCARHSLYGVVSNDEELICERVEELWRRGRLERPLRERQQPLRPLL